MSIGEELRTNGSVKSKLLILTYRFGNMVLYRGKVPILKQFMWALYKVLDLFFVKIVCQAEIPASCKIGKFINFPHGANGVVIHPDAVIGEHVSILHQVTIGAKDFDKGGEGVPIIGDNVYVGAGAKIIGKIIVQDGAMIGANSVVLKDVSSNTTVAGVPARVVSKPQEDREIKQEVVE